MLELQRSSRPGFVRTTCFCDDKRDMIDRLVDINANIVAFDLIPGERVVDFTVHDVITGEYLADCQSFSFACSIDDAVGRVLLNRVAFVVNPADDSEVLEYTETAIVNSIRIENV